MKAVVIEKFNKEYSLAFCDVDPPAAPIGSEVLIRVRAAGLNRADLLQARGLYPPPMGFALNRPGLEFAGIVEQTGKSVRRWNPGERVFGITAGEAQGELLLIDERLITRIPDNMDFASAAAVPEAFITAHDAIVTLGGIKAGENLLIHAVGSGVGLAALQIAKAKGVFVIGTSWTAEKLERCKPYGLDLGIETTTGVDFGSGVLAATNGKGANVILDLVGAAYFGQNLASLVIGGRLILVGLTSGRTAEFNLGLALQKRATIIGTVLRPRSIVEKAEATRRFAEDVLPLLESGQIKPNLDRVFPAAEVSAAYKYLESNESFGKVVLEF